MRSCGSNPSSFQLIKKRFQSISHCSPVSNERPWPFLNDSGLFLFHLLAVPVPVSLMSWMYTLFTTYYIIFYPLIVFTIQFRCLPSPFLSSDCFLYVNLISFWRQEPWLALLELSVQFCIQKVHHKQFWLTQKNEPLLWQRSQKKGTLSGLELTSEVIRVSH